VISFPDLGSAMLEQIIPVGLAKVPSVRKHEHSQPPMVGRIKPCAECRGAGTPEAPSGMQQCSAPSLPTSNHAQHS